MERVGAGESEKARQRDQKRGFSIKKEITEAVSKKMESDYTVEIKVCLAL